MARNPTLSAAAAHGRRGADPGDPGPGHEVWKVRRPAHHGVAAECGWPVGKDRVQRIWQREGLKVPQKPRPIRNRWVERQSLSPFRSSQSWKVNGRLGNIEHLFSQRHCSQNAFTWNKTLNVLHRFVGKRGCPSRLQHCPENTRTEYPRRVSW